MNIATNRRRVVEKGSGNVYVDLSNHDAEAMLFKAQLVRRINGIIEKRALTLKLTARIAGLSPAKLAPILRGKFRRIDEAHLLVCLTSLKNYDDLKENFARLEADLKDWQGTRMLPPTEN